MASDAAAALRKMCGVLTCPLCSRLFSDPHRFSGCGHEFCRECIVGKLEGPGVVTSECPTCRQPAWKKDLVADQLYASLVKILRSSPGAEAGSAGAAPQQELSRPTSAEAAAPRPASRSSSPKRKKAQRQRKQGSQPAKAEAAGQGAAGYAQLAVQRQEPEAGAAASAATPGGQCSGQQEEPQCGAVPATPEAQRSSQQQLAASPACVNSPAAAGIVAQAVPATPAEQSRSRQQQGQPEVVPATPAEQQRSSQQQQGDEPAGSVQDTPPPSQLVAAVTRTAQGPSGKGRCAGMAPTAVAQSAAAGAGWAQSFVAEVREAAQPTQLYLTPMATAAPASEPGGSGRAVPAEDGGQRFSPAWAAEELDKASSRLPEGASLPGLVTEVSALLAAVSQAQQLLAAAQAGVGPEGGGGQRSLEDLDAAMRQHGFRFTETEVGLL